jgi:DNA-directed RNA polymerase subunit RPC12/RpoP
MKHCSNCKKTPTFIAVLSAINPARIKCTYCKQTIIIKTLPAVIATFIALILSLAAIALSDYLGYGISGMIIALVTTGLALEVGYFWGIRNGHIASNLSESPK